jgi:hypothetical protein
MFSPICRAALIGLATLATSLAATVPPVAAAGTPPPTCYITTDGISGVIAVYGHGGDSALCADNRVAPGQHAQSGQLPDGLALVCTTDGGQAAVYDDSVFPDGSGIQMCSSAMATGAVVIWNK